MYDIQNRLSHVQGLIVKSSIGSEHISIVKNSIPQISKEFKVSYILEGSMIKKDDRIRIYIHLIDAEANIVWSSQYDHDISNILGFVSDVSIQVVQSLHAPLQFENIQKLDKQYTFNEKAYLLYLEGRFYYRLRTEASYHKSIELFNKALQIDSGYSLAYAGLADSYLTGTWNGYFSVKEGIPKCKMYLKKALNIDPNLCEAHTTCGGLATYFDSDYKMAEQHLKLALELNPGYDRANKIYAEYLDVVGRKEEARNYINKAHFLNPTYSEILNLSFVFYCHVGDYEKALCECKRLYDLDKNEARYYEKCFNVYLELHKDSLAFLSFKKMNELKKYGITIAELERVYAKKNIDGIVQLHIDLLNSQNNDALTSYRKIFLAEYYIIIGEKQKAIESLEESYLINPAPVHRVYNNVAFQTLKSEPKYRDLMKKINLGIN